MYCALDTIAVVDLGLRSLSVITDSRRDELPACSLRAHDPGGTSKAACPYAGLANRRDELLACPHGTQELSQLLYDLYLPRRNQRQQLRDIANLQNIRDIKSQWPLRAPISRWQKTPR